MREIGIRGSKQKAAKDLPQKKNWRIISQMLFLQAHMEVHSSDRPYTCPQCNKGFKQLAQMKNHQVIHKDVLPNMEGKWWVFDI